MINKKQLFEQLGTTPASYLFFFLILLWSCIIQIAMCFNEVEDLIFSCDCLPSGRHCEKHFAYNCGLIKLAQQYCKEQCLPPFYRKQFQVK